MKKPDIGADVKRSAGILLYRRRGRDLEVMLVHPGGPFWRNKDAGAWSIPKGEIDDREDPLAAAIREFEEETGTRLSGDFVPLGEIRQRAGKRVSAWAHEADFDVTALQSQTFELHWPPRSGRRASFPEVDRAEWFDAAVAEEKILAGQSEFIGRLQRHLAAAEAASATPPSRPRKPSHRPA